MPLPDEAIQKLRLMLVSSGWKDVMEPILAKRAHDAIKALVLAPAERRGEMAGVDDATLRARIQEDEWMLIVWRNEINAADIERRQLNELESRDGGENAGNSTG
jgi:hypothetical protein